VVCKRRIIMKKPYKIKILGGEEDGNVKGFFSKYQLPQAIAMLTAKNGKDWAYDLQEVNERSTDS
jgi:hypothetical protein